MADLAAQLGPDSFLVYMNLGQGIRMKYPNGWEKREDAGAAGFMVIFLSQQEDPFDQFRENVNLFIERLPQPMTVEQVAAANRETMLQQMPINFVEEATKDILGGLPAYRVSYTGPLGQLAGKWLQYYAVKGDKAYTLTYTAEAGKYQKFSGVVQQIIASLEIK